MPLQMFKQRERGLLDDVQHVVAIAAGEGGVGKSSVTVYLALALRSAGYSVGILDADLYGPSIRKMLPEETLPVQKGERILPAVSKGIRTISMAYFRRENESTAVRAPIANGVIAQFLQQVDWGVLDFLLIDFPPGTGDIQLTLSQQAHLTGALVVTTPQEVALLDVRKAIHLFEQMHIPVIGIVENMSYYLHAQEKIYLFGEGGGKRLAQEVGTPFLGDIPLDPELCRAGDDGCSLGKNTPAAQAFDALAQQFVAHVTALQRLKQESLSSFELSWKEMS